MELTTGSRCQNVDRAFGSAIMDCSTLAVENATLEWQSHSKNTNHRSLFDMWPYRTNEGVNITIINLKITYHEP
jgi:hypothetical protein